MVFHVDALGLKTNILIPAEEYLTPQIISALVTSALIKASIGMWPAVITVLRQRGCFLLTQKLITLIALLLWQSIACII